LQRTERERVDPTPKSHFGAGRESKTLPQKSNLLNYLLNNKTWLVIAILLTVTVLSAWGVINNIKPVEADSANSGTHLPISKGGTGAGEKSDALKNLLPDLANNNGKVLGLTSGTPTWVNTGATVTSSNDDGKVKILEDTTMKVNKSYSTAEVNTGATWTDGKPIYRRVFEGNIVAAASTSINTNIFTSATPIFDALVAYGGYWLPGSASRTAVSYVSEYSSSGMFLTDTTVIFVSKASNARAGNTNNAYKIWVEYTKL
jgi:hypothetical protein